MTSAPINFNSITADTAKKIQQDYVNKKKGRLPTEGVGEVRHPRPVPGPVKPKTVRLSATEIKGMEARIDQAHPEIKEKKVQEMVKTKVRMITKITDYKRKFPHKFEHIRVPPPSSSNEHVRAVLQEVRDTLSTEGAELQVRKALPLSAALLEHVTMKMGINPTNMQLTGFGAMMAAEDVQSALEPETTEAVVELKEYLVSPFWMRYMFKVFLLAQAYSEGESIRRTASQRIVDPNLTARYADLEDPARQ